MWTMLVFFAWVIWFWLLITVFSDIFRRHDISGWGKAGWTVFVIILPFLGVFIYMIAESKGMAERSAKQVQAAQTQTDDYFLQLAHDLRRELLRQERHLVALRVGRIAAVRVPPDDRRELGFRAQDDRDLQAEALGDHALDLAANTLRFGAALEDDVAALQVRLHLAEAGLLERRAQLRHRDPVARADVDPAEQSHVAGHQGIIGRDGRGRPRRALRHRRHPDLRQLAGLERGAREDH